MKFEIKHRFSGAVLFALETESLKLCVEAAVKAGSDLSGSDLRGSDLRGSDLRGSDLRGSDLRGSDLSGSNLSGSNLSGSNLSGSNLSGSDLSGSDLSGSDGKTIKTIGERPLLSLGPLGSRADYLQAWLTDAGIYVRAGCFWDTLAKFKAAVKETHGDGPHAQEYAAAITLIEMHARLWTPEKPA